ncbi:MAG: hypothetical protein EOL97_09610 [Spirochaetia bacterium]|nr:hypothetical protein [Spirochaetia bacterium]
MTEKNDDIRVVKISMPKDYARNFCAYIDDKFYSSRFIYILYLEKMLDALMQKTDIETKLMIESARQDILILMKHYKKELFWN